MTAAMRLQIQTALGRDVVKAAEQIQFCLNTYQKADAALWRTFLQALHEGAGETVMFSPLGMVMQLAILGRIQNGNDGAALPRRKPTAGSGFPNKRQF